MAWLLRLVVLMAFTMLLAVGLPVVGMLRERNGGLALVQRFALQPAPWRVAKLAGGTALRLAMVHDVLHERYWRHGPAWYVARQQRALAALAAWSATADADRGPASAGVLAVLDDLAVGGERLGRSGEGLAYARRKLALQCPGVTVATARADLAAYSTYANLGTLMVHSSSRAAIAGDAGAAATMREGLCWIQLAMASNPDAHFGRETWQAQAVSSLLAAIAKPERLLQRDLMGCSFPVGQGLFAQYHDSRDVALAMADALSRSGPPLLDSTRPAALAEVVEQLRELIPGVPILEDGPTPPSDLVPFDEPTLGIIGLWTLGGGANPHFALALAHLMEGIGQGHLAWNAYERAVELGDGFWPDAAIRARLLAHCRDRQRIVEHRIGEDPARLRRLHQDELAFGQRQQREYQDYERARLLAGADPAAADFYADFFRTHAALATAPGAEDTVAYALPRPWWAWAPLVGGGISVLALLVLGVALNHRWLMPELRRQY